MLLRVLQGVLVHCIKLRVCGGRRSGVSSLVEVCTLFAICSILIWHMIICLAALSASMVIRF